MKSMYVLLLLQINFSENIIRISETRITFIMNHSIIALCYVEFIAMLFNMLDFSMLLKPKIVLM